MSKFKMIAVISVGALAIGTTGGWKMNGWRLEAKYAKTQAAVISQYEERQKELNSKFAEQMKKDATARMALSQGLADSRSKAARLLEKLENQQISQTNPTIEKVLIPGDCNAGQPEVVLANPFGDDFVKLWNDSTSDIVTRDP
jgi:hypothetical protein